MTKLKEVAMSMSTAFGNGQVISDAQLKPYLSDYILYYDASPSGCRMIFVSGDWVRSELSELGENRE